ncbi:MAG: glycine cleavage T C-terminal barrel domain-containing protein [Chloroflexota bacterium]
MPPALDGTATSGTWSPSLKQLIALATVEAAFETPGTPLSLDWTVEGRPGRLGAMVVPLPFLDLPRRRA